MLTPCYCPSAIISYKNIERCSDSTHSIEDAAEGFQLSFNIVLLLLELREAQMAGVPVGCGRAGRPSGHSWSVQIIHW